MGKLGIFSSFWLKIFAMFFMVLDHVGLMMSSYYYYNHTILQIANVFRILGRFALPLFLFMIVEGVMHTKNIKKYCLRLGIFALLISMALIVITYVDFGFDLSYLTGAGNIFLDLLLAAFAAWLIKQDNKPLKLLLFVPVGISVASFLTKMTENAGLYTVHWYPNWLFMQYDVLSIFLAMGFALSYKIADSYIEYSAERGIDKSVWEADGKYRLLVNIISVSFIIIGSILFYLIRYIWPQGIFWDAETQLFAMISGAFILLYNGKRGYNAKWFQYGSYLFYPVHLLVIALIFVIINGGL